ncbi:unnamed protein product [Symbiodinium sp. CCMP2456]|nr:unnamed protein product [Symbiodinium sp. CCMP2456]
MIREQYKSRASGGLSLSSSSAYPGSALPRPSMPTGGSSNGFGTEASRRKKQQKDAAHWAKVADMLDTNNSGTLSFLELARGLRWTGQSPRPTEVQGFDEVLGHREALLRACRALDADGCGRLPAEVFASLLAATAPLAPAPEGTGAVAYAEILSSFEVVLDPDLVKAAARG